LLGRVARGDLVPLGTTAFFLEYEGVLLRPEQRLATGMSEEDVAGFLSAFASAAQAVNVYFQWRPQLTHPSDEMVLEAAICGSAGILVTHNVGDFDVVPGRFGIRVVTPGELLKELSK